MNGIINLMKPPCMSSAQAVAFVKRMTGMKAGHAGTLDPEAAGVLPIMVGKATRLFDFLTEREKVYVAEVAFGTATDTQDATGAATEVDRSSLPSEPQVRAALAAFQGTVLQVPPSFSAIKRDGKALYELARRGEHVAVEARPVEVFDIQYLRSMGEDGHLIRVHCGKGTYIRTLCHDLGVALRTPAHMRMLVREKSGRFDIAQAIPLEELQAAYKDGTRTGPWLVSAQEAVDHLPKAIISEALVRSCLHGVPVPAGSFQCNTTLSEGDAVSVFGEEALVGVYTFREGMLRVRVLLAG